MFDHEGPAVVSAMCNLTSGVFEQLDITSFMEVDQRIVCSASLEEKRLKIQGAPDGIQIVS